MQERRERIGLICGLAAPAEYQSYQNGFCLSNLLHSSMTSLRSRRWFLMRLAHCIGTFVHTETGDQPFRCLAQFAENLLQSLQHRRIAFRSRVRPEAGEEFRCVTQLLNSNA